MWPLWVNFCASKLFDIYPNKFKSLGKCLFFFFLMTKTPLIWQLALLGRDIVGSFKSLMLPKSFSTTSPKAVRLGLGHCSLPRWQLGVWQCYEELQLLISELLQCWWQRCKLILKLTEGTWRGPTAYLRGRGQGKTYQWNWVSNTFRTLCLVVKVVGTVSIVFGRGACLRKIGGWKITCKRVMTECFQYFVILEMIYWTHCILERKN